MHKTLLVLIAVLLLPAVAAEIKNVPLLIELDNQSVKLHCEQGVFAFTAGSMQNLSFTCATEYNQTVLNVTNTTVVQVINQTNVTVVQVNGTNCTDNELTYNNVQIDYAKLREGFSNASCDVLIKDAVLSAVSDYKGTVRQDVTNECEGIKASVEEFKLCSAQRDNLQLDLQVTQVQLVNASATAQLERERREDAVGTAWWFGGMAAIALIIAGASFIILVGQQSGWMDRKLASLFNKHFLPPAKPLEIPKAGKKDDVP